MRFKIRILVPLLVFGTAAGGAQAQEWQHTLTPYLWMTGMSGKAAIGTALGPVEADVGLSLVRIGPGAGPSRSAGRNESWIDPVIGVVTQLPLNERWSLDLRGDLAGFGVGYENGSGNGQFKYDVVTSGPGLGISFKF